MTVKFLTLLLLMTASVLNPGDQAPEFTAESTDGSHISLSDYRGKSNVVLFFYPEDMTGGCTKEACSFRDDLSKYQLKETVILGVSSDDRQKHQQFTEKENLNFPLLVDADGKICEAYGVPRSEDRWPKRWTYLIGKDGKIIKKYDKVNPTTHSEEILNDLASHLK